MEAHRWVQNDTDRLARSLDKEDSSFGSFGRLGRCVANDESESLVQVSDPSSHIRVSWVMERELSSSNITAPSNGRLREIRSPSSAFRLYLKAPLF